MQKSKTGFSAKKSTLGGSATKTDGKESRTEAVSKQVNQSSNEVSCIKGKELNFSLDASFETAERRLVIDEGTKGEGQQRKNK